MAEDADFNPGAWKGHDFADARDAYDKTAGRAYTQARETGTKGSDLVPERISTQSLSPLAIVVDVTGSFGDWPKTIFSKLPYLDIEGREYLGADAEISFGANGDYTCDKYPLQVQAFGAGTVLKDHLGKLIIEGGGGGQHTESYEMGALFYANNVDMPNAVSPVFIFIADEQPYPRITKADALRIAKVAIQKDMTVDEVFDQLKSRWSVYLIHKPYADGGATRREWARLLGEDRIADLDDPNRVVDVIFGILAKETGRIDYFRDEIEKRQEVNTPAGKKKVDTVYRALNTIHRPVNEERFKALDVPVGGKSTLHNKGASKKAKSLLGGS